MRVNPVFVALNVVFLFVSAWVGLTHGDAWAVMPVAFWVAYLLWVDHE